ncbi:uncharacterized protein LAESUDRAFT_667510, partial [Laetiporus sulphureus 93-53]
DDEFIFITNLVNGVDQYKFPSLERLRSYTYPIVHNRIMQIATFGTNIVVGGDDGFARLFDSRTGRLIECLNHSSGACKGSNLS